ncbi:MAG: sel1 repeat family protein [gamma proteobacterium endosymbiont of Lamellibrachia anaximandri]|nr:sel1 repeat family protein [gamma proteobacterium endosymbiont of Lamellibrachia anaximandri]MBL3535583.1 sel1 repeat family protein [gamma proteobacterium endosymbiont of Lamellibrachia anaximandri]
MFRYLSDKFNKLGGSSKEQSKLEATIICNRSNTAFVLLSIIDFNEINIDAYAILQKLTNTRTMDYENVDRLSDELQIIRARLVGLERENDIVEYLSSNSSGSIMPVNTEEEEESGFRRFLKSNDPEILHMYGATLFSSGDYILAEEFMRKAIDLGSPNALYTLSLMAIRGLVATDVVTLYSWVYLAHLTGHEQASETLKIICQHMTDAQIREAERIGDNQKDTYLKLISSNSSPNESE